MRMWAHSVHRFRPSLPFSATPAYHSIPFPFNQTFSGC